MSGGAPSQPVDRFHYSCVVRLWHGLQSEKCAVLPKGFGIGLSHPAALKTAIHCEFNAADAKHLVAVIRSDIPRGYSLRQFIGITRVKERD